MRQLTEAPYNIVTNRSQHRILVINEPVNVDDTPELQFEDFDAIFINVIDNVMDRNMLAIRLASPLLSEKCRFKPCFVTRRLMGWLGKSEVIVDGYATTPTDDSMARTIEDIYSNMRRHNFLLGTEPVVTHAEEVVRLCRYAISRGRYTFSSEPTPGLSEGYMALYYYTLWFAGQQDMQAEERDFFHKQLLRLGYIRRTRFIDRIHVCPMCKGSSLLFFETCPECGSSDIREEPVIHHFRCANVSPEHTYQQDGELVCPKCKKILRHIGVDYDRPSSIYTCGQCDHTFMYPNMRVLCPTNRRAWRPDELQPVNVEEYEFTPEGIRAFASNEVERTLNHTGFYGYSSMTDFISYLRQFTTPDILGDAMVIVGRFYIFDPALDDLAGHDATPPVVQTLQRFFNYKQAMWGNNYYFLCRVPSGQVAKALADMEFEIKEQLRDYQDLHAGFEFEMVDTYTYHPGDDVEQFIRRIEEDRN
ncbi:MAG: hypothetical protein K2J63_09065 [Muribaculaceae bacterium]|nr:hypothetical protein [Muribaculaceae bacterium]MDE6795434.1 hypothetical protein [Muribaculaceae bacterium]